MRVFFLKTLFVTFLQTAIFAAGEEEATKQVEGADQDENSTLIVLPQLTVPIVRHGVIFSYYIFSLTIEAQTPEEAIQVRRRVPFLMDALFSDLYKILALNYRNKIPKERIKVYISAIYNKVFDRLVTKADVRSLNYHGIGKKV